MYYYDSRHGDSKNYGNVESMLSDRNYKGDKKFFKEEISIKEVVISGICILTIFFIIGNFIY